MIELHVDGSAGVEILTQVKLAAARFPGRLSLVVVTDNGRITLGPEWRYDLTPECRAALTEFGTVTVR